MSRLPERAGAIYDLGYRRYDGFRLGRRSSMLALFTQGLRSAFGLGRRPASKIAPFALAAYWVTLFAATHWPRAPELLGIGRSDKLLHLVAYFVLAALLGANVALRGRLGWRPLLVCLAIVVAFGAFDEVTQPAFGRDANRFDWLADCTGAAAGLLAVAALAALWQRPVAQ